MTSFQKIPVSQLEASFNLKMKSEARVERQHQIPAHAWMKSKPTKGFAVPIDMIGDNPAKKVVCVDFLHRTAKKMATKWAVFVADGAEVRIPFSIEILVIFDD